MCDEYGGGAEHRFFWCCSPSSYGISWEVVGDRLALVVGNQHDRDRFPPFVIETVAPEALEGFLVSHSHAVGSDGGAEDSLAHASGDETSEELEETMIFEIHDHCVAAVAVQDLSEDDPVAESDDRAVAPVRRDDDLAVPDVEEYEWKDAHGGTPSGGW